MVPRYHALPQPFWAGASWSGSVLLHSAQPDAHAHVSWLYSDPIDALTVEGTAGAAALLERAEAHRRAGRWIAGFIGYDAGHALVGLEDPPHSAETAAWLGVYRGAWRFDHLSGQATPLGSAARDGHLSGTAPTGVVERNFVPPRFGAFGLDAAAYRAKLARIHAYLSAGDTYQVNFTDRFEADFDGDLLELYRALIGGHPVSYGAFVNVGGDNGLQIASLSPELFFRTDGHRIMAKPMKGTTTRGRDVAEDARLADALRNDPKSRAENVMIVDLLRNDLGRVCAHGSVRVPELFAVERYRTVQQMTSTVTGTLRDDVRLPDLFEALFPCGSVTGAPKRRTMQIIRELERGPRGVYTGAIGHVAPSGDATFSVAIRTLVRAPGPAGGRSRNSEQRGASAAERGQRAGGRSRTSAHLTLGAGGGIVADSDPAAEYRECALKARFATEPAEPFELIETLRWDDGYRFLDAHLARLERSADYFGFALDPGAVRAALLGAPGRDPGVPVLRVGLRLACSGAFDVQCVPFEVQGRGAATSRWPKPGEPEPREPEPREPKPPERSPGRPPLKVALADDRIDSGDPFQRHKTTNRARYAVATERARRNGLADILFLNERGELTEGAISNLFLEIGGELLTPPLDMGVLPGIYRGHLLETDPRAREAFLTPRDLVRANRIWLCSSLRGMREVSLQPASAPA